jgi:RHS repeat-associated protein
MLNNVAGKPIRMWDSRNHTLRTTYDVLMRPTQLFVKAGAESEILVEKTIYGEEIGAVKNHRGKIYQHFDSAGVATNVEFDFKGNLEQSTRQLVQNYKTIPNWSSNPNLETEIFSSSTRYDALNRPIQLVVPYSNQPNTKINIIRPSYNEANLLEQIDAWLGESAAPTTLLNPQLANFHPVINIDYNAKGQRTKIEYGNGAQTEYTYDKKTFRLTHLRTARNSAVLQNLFYTYDPVGNITHIRDDAQQTIFFKGQVVLPHCDYIYDAIYRLIEATGREHIGQVGQPETTWNDEFRVNLPHPNDGQAMRNYTEQYIYDAVGNFEKLIHQAANGNWNRSYAYNESSLIEPAKKSNRLSSTTVGAKTDPYTYDAHGNMTSMPHLTLMQWNYKDELSATSRQAANNTPAPEKVPETTFYVYDASGQRVRKVTEGQNGARNQERIYLGVFEIYREFNSNGNDIKLERETLHIMDDKQRIGLVETRTQGHDDSLKQLIRFKFSNHLGSVNLELDNKANVISYEEYYPYGSTSYQSVDNNIKVTVKHYRYTGKERDEETGLYYHGARYYAPWLGRWTSSDPAKLVDGVNVYSYVNNNPTGWNDPTGMWGWREVAVVAAVVVVGTVVTVATAGAAAPVIAGAVASIGLSGAAATVATGVAIGAVAGAAGGAFGSAAGEATRQTVNSRALGLGNEEFSGRAIASAAGQGAIEGAAIGAAVGGAAAFATTATGAAVIGAVGRTAQRVAPTLSRAAVSTARGVASAARTVARIPGVSGASRGLQALEQAGHSFGTRLARGAFQSAQGLFQQGARGAEALRQGAAAVERFDITRSAARTFGAAPTEGRVPIQGRLNVGGGDEQAGMLVEGRPEIWRQGEYSNLQPYIPNTGGPSSGVPNAISGRAEQIDQIFAPGSIRQMISRRLAGPDLSIDEFAASAYSGMAKGGRFELHFGLGGAPQAEAQAFSRVGFRDVQIEHGVLLTGKR